MDVMEKSVELVKNALRAYGKDLEKIVEPYEFIADFLISNGVTVQGLDGCEYCNDPHPARDCVLPDGTERFLAEFDDGTFFGKPLIYERKIKFCPMCGRKLPQPPKGE